MGRDEIKTRYFIIGNSAGGIGGVEAIRQADKEGSIIISSDEPYPAYSRPLISKYLTGARGLEDILYRPRGFYEEIGIHLIHGCATTQLNLDQKTAELSDGKKIHWEKLLIATGGKPIKPPTPGLEKKGVFNFLTLDDANRIKAFLKSNDVRNVIVIGGGLIGTSVTEALVKHNVKVTIVELKERILNVILDETGSTIMADTLSQAGINIITNHVVAEILGDDRVEGIVLDDGVKISCQMVVVAIGVLPRTELLQEKNIEINRGIVIDSTMCTSRKDIYACGDVAEAYDFVYGDGRLVPIWPNAYIGGRTAGFNMAGIPTLYPGGTSMNALNYFGLAMVSAGLVNESSKKEGFEILSHLDSKNYQKVILKDGRLVGLVSIGDIERSGILFGLMRDGIDVSLVKDRLLAADFGLVHLPDGLWRSKLTSREFRKANTISLSGDD
jgi:NAD(P)H-nitrite reductase large subunit